MSKYLWVLDAGHGGVIDGRPQTPGKRSPNWEKGVLYEGVSNRIILNKVKCLLDESGISNINITPNDLDIPLRKRVAMTNDIYKRNKNSILLSFHSDGFDTNESANGWSAFTSPGSTNSDKVADVLYKYAGEAGFKLRTDHSDGDIDKEANFYLLRKTFCPSVLIENLFMTNKKDYKVLMSQSGQDKISNMIFNSILEIEKNGL